MKKVKWISIAFILVLICSFLTSIITNESIKYVTSSLIGFIIGFICMICYKREE